MQIRAYSPKREVHGKQTEINFTRAGWDYLISRGVEQEKVIGYKGPLENLIKEYGLKKGTHYKIRKRIAKD